MKLRGITVFLCAMAAWPVMAQGPAWDSSGNSLLKGNYYFRQVMYGNSASALYGGISFDGNGNWTIGGGQVYSTSTNAAQAFTASGTYTVAASGFGFLTSPADSTQRVYVMVSNGIAIGSATENSAGYEDLFVAAPLANPQPTVSSLQGTYQLSYFRPDYYYGPTADVDALVQMSSTGAGVINASMNGYNGAGGTGTQISNSLKYTYSNGAANITFPNNSNAAFITGENEYLYMSPDGNFVFGGSPTDLDIFVGVKTNNSNPSNFSGMFYQAGLDDDNSAGNGYLDSWYGSLSVLSGGNIISHQRFAYGGSGASGNTYADTYGSFQNGGYTNTNTGLQYVFSQNGAIRVGLGQYPIMGINVAVQAPTLTQSGVFLNPQGITNSANTAPFTAGISNGELITLYGSNLAQSTVVATSLPFPTSLGGVQVLINGANAPIYYVSPTQISVIVPFENTFSVAQIQVTSSAGASNTITSPVYQTTPGAYTIDSRFGGVGPGGLGFAAAEHGDYSVVSKTNPAQPGETIQLYVTGLGNVSPANPDGAAGPTNPFSVPTNTFTVDVGGTTVPAPMPFIGLAPALAGLYQINFQIPSGLASGTYLLGIQGPDSYTDEAEIQVGTASTSTSVAATPAIRMHPATRLPHATSRAARPTGSFGQSRPLLAPNK
ncbi:MAG TPA: hypothetical protein VG345_02020 [Bryobacteraceae bacterium]|nr:hypothetical protein [Bryobacteraceae bacterium]